MNICVTSRGEDLNAQVDPRFGRCQFFVVVDPKTMEFESVKNPNMDASGGAGIQSGQLMARKKVGVVLTGHVGPNAYETLSAANINIITGISGTITEAIRSYQKGDLESASGPTVKSKAGI